MVNEEKSISILEAILAPFFVLKKEKNYIWWIIIVIIFGAINIWAGLFCRNFIEIKNALYQGQLYTFSIAICAPFAVTFPLDILITKRSRKDQHFIAYKIISIIISFIFIVTMCFMWVGEFKSNITAQLIVASISLIFSFYMFCITEMIKQPYIVTLYDDKEYINEENHSIKEKIKKAEKTNKISDEEEGEIQL